MCIRDSNAIFSKDGNIFISYYFYDYMKSEEYENLKEESLDDNTEDATDDKYFEPEYKYASVSYTHLDVYKRQALSQLTEEELA